MEITFTDKNARTTVIRVDTETEIDTVMALLSQIPDSEFILRPVKEM